MNNKGAIKKLRSLTFNGRQEVAAFRAGVEEQFCVEILPNNTECEETSFGSIKCDVLTPEMFCVERVIIYVHGGSFVGGSAACFRAWGATLANKSLTKVIIPEYRLSPESPFPAAVEDIQRVFHFLCAQLTTQKKVNTKFVIAADGAGANIALAFMLSLGQEHRATIQRLVLFSPILNLSDTLFGGGKKQDEVISSEALRIARTIYAPGSDYKKPTLSPINATSDLLKGFPPVYMQLGGRDPALADARVFSEVLRRAGVSSLLDVFPSMPHEFQLSMNLSETLNALQRFSALFCASSKAPKREVWDNKPVLEKSL